MDPLLYTIPENSNIDISNNNRSSFIQNYENKIDLIISRLSDNRYNIFTHCIFFFNLLNREDVVNANIELTRIKSLVKSNLFDIKNIKHLSKFLIKTNIKCYKQIIDQLYVYNDFKHFSKDTFILALYNICILVQQYNCFKQHLDIYIRHLNSPHEIKLNFLKKSLQHYYYLKKLYNNNLRHTSATYIFINYIKLYNVKFIDKTNTLKNIYNIFKKIEEIIL